jgi:hypothetical protein
MDSSKTRTCLSCGEIENLGKRRYCSLACRQRLRLQLNMRTGLLKALNTRYATFYFTGSQIVLDVLTLSSKDLFHFTFPRMPGKKPADDFIRMSNHMANEWWAEKRKTDKRYLANRYVFERAQKDPATAGTRINPDNLLIPVVNLKTLACLKLNRSELHSPDPISAIKAAYRRMAKQHHPDQGGDAADFRKIHDAYRQLLEWSENPKFTRRCGFADKWFYNGAANRWVQPRTLP